MKKLTALYEEAEPGTTPPVASVAVRDSTGIASTTVGGRPGTRFQAASISKAVAAAAALRLVADDVIALDRDVTTYLRSWRPPSETHVPFTLRQLLSHSAGLTVHGFPGYAPGLPLPTLPQILDGADPANTGPVRVAGIPGLTFKYSGGGYTVVQQLMEDVTGAPFADLADELVFRPAGMFTATYHPDSDSTAVAHVDGRPVAGGGHRYPEQAAAGMWCTAEDLIRFVSAIRDAAEGDGELLPTALAREMLTEQAAPLGLGLFLEPDPVLPRFGHGGDNHGFTCFVTASRTGPYAVAVMHNDDTSIDMLTRVKDTAMRETGWPHTAEETTRSRGVRTLDDWRHRYGGDWRLPDGRNVRIDWPRDGGDDAKAPTITVGDGAALTLTVHGLRHVSVDAVRTELEFDLDSSGRATTMTIRQFGTESTATRV
ncbi:hypothetical protein GCM10023223_15940 [Stackebrandtia albiflava]